MIQKGERQQTHRQIDRHYQTYYLPCFAFDKKHLSKIGEKVRFSPKMNTKHEISQIQNSRLKMKIHEKVEETDSDGF